jgi:SAM-dependent methyltransferase
MEARPLPTPRPTTRADRQRLLGRLRAIGYDEAACAARLGVTRMRDAARPLEIDRRIPERARVRPALGENADALDVLIALFLFRRPVPAATLARALTLEDQRTLMGMRLLDRDGAGLRSHVLLFPCQGLLVATDGLGLEPGINKVMPLFPESYDLADLTVRTPCERALDLCTGSGIHALLASRRCREVVGVDVSPRAIAFSRFNAWLNRIENVQFRLGDLYAPLEPGAGYDLVTANPPYNPEIDSPAGADYHSGGESGEEVLERVLRGLRGFLSPAGYAQIVALLIHREGDEPEARIERWLGSGFDVLTLAREMDYRPEILKAKRLSGRDRALQESWKRQRIVGFRFGIVNVRRTPPGRAAFLAGAPIRDGFVGPGHIDVAEAFTRLSGQQAQALQGRDGAGDLVSEA